MKDDRLISLNAAIDAFAPYAEYESNRTNAEWVRRINMVLSALPSAQPGWSEQYKNKQSNCKKMPLPKPWEGRQDG